MTRRPIPVTVISCIEIATGILPVVGIVIDLLLSSPTPDEMVKSAVPVPIQYAMSIITTVVLLSSGYFMLRGRNWARWLCVGWSIFGPLYSAATSPMKWMLLPSVIYLILIVYFLFRRDANEFFADSERSPIQQGMPSWRSILSISLYMLSGFALGVTCLMAFFAYPDGAAIAKLFIQCTLLLPAGLLLGLGRILSEDPNWKREVGTVLVVSSVFGALISLTLALLFNDPIYRARHPSVDMNFYGDYLMGGLWIIGMFLIGVLLLRMASRQAKTPPVRAPIFGSKRP